MDLTVVAWTKDPARQLESDKPEPPKIPGGPAIRNVRGFGATGVPATPERGLLLIYPLDPGFAEMPEGSSPVTAFGVSFPSSKSNTTVKYEVDHLLWEREYGSAD